MNTTLLITLLIVSTLLSVLTLTVVAKLFLNQIRSSKDLETLATKRDDVQQLLLNQSKHWQEFQTDFMKLQSQAEKNTHDGLIKGLSESRSQMTEKLTEYTKQMTERVDQLTRATENKLKEIHGEVDKQLSKGFEKTTATFADVMKRLIIIDEAQKKITELSSSVVSLQEVLNDKRSRGAFGEVQLAALIRNMIPESNFSLQHTLSTGKRVDCLLMLPEPTGNVAIDAKFPLESYRKLQDTKLSASDKTAVEAQFKQDIKKHIKDISQKYIIEGETADGAMMFIPAEAVFAEIHAHHPDLIDIAHKAHVWLVSPTTMMAILTTARAVLKDAATRKQVHVIQEHLGKLGKDFGRFQERMDNLAKHFDRVQEDVDLVHKSSKKISGHFDKIEKVELDIETEEEAKVIE